jgi:pimeloyl-ACP methyl ester carboxylesterase
MEQEADVLNELLDYWKIDKAMLFGHSDGGSIALIAAAKYPQKTLGIITEDAHIFVEDITIMGIKEGLNAYQTTNLKTKLEKYHGIKTDDMFWAWASTWTTTEFRSWNIESFMPSIQCPALIIQGEADEYGTLIQVENTISIVIKVVKYCIPNIGHTPHKERPEIVFEKASGFINQLINN